MPVKYTSTRFTSISTYNITSVTLHITNTITTSGTSATFDVQCTSCDSHPAIYVTAKFCVYQLYYVLQSLYHKYYNFSYDHNIGKYRLPWGDANGATCPKIFRLGVVFTVIGNFHKQTMFYLIPITLISSTIF